MVCSGRGSVSFTIVVVQVYLWMCGGQRWIYDAGATLRNISNGANLLVDVCLA